MRKLFIHCIGNQKSGLGHFSRCLALASILKKNESGIELTFVGCFELHALEKLKIAKIDYINVKEEVCFTTYIFQAVALTTEDFFLVDSYIASQDFYDQMTYRSFKWGVFDDFSTKDFSSSNLVINFRVNAGRLFDYSAKYCALGPKYMPVRLEFEDIRKKNENLKVLSGIKKVVICLGGSDLYNVSGQLLHTITQVFAEAEIYALLSDEREIVQLVEKYKNNKKIYIESLKPDIENLLYDTDLIISGGGMLKYEAGYCAIPNATLSQTEEQYQDTLILEKEGLTINLGLAKQYNPENLIRKLSVFCSKERQVMRSKQLVIFPRDSNSNLVNIINNQYT